MTEKKICFVVSSPLTVNAFLRNHINELAKKYKIYVVANMQNSDENVFRDLPLEELIHVEIVRNINIFKDFKAINSLKNIMKRKKFDAVHSVTPKAGLIAMIASQKAGIKNRIHIFTGQVWHTKKGVFKRILMSVDQLIVYSATHILVDGKSQRNFLIKKNIINDENSKVLGAGSISGVEVNRFHPNNDLRNILRKQLHISEDEVVFSFLGRMNKDKGITELGLAFNKLAEKYPNVKLFLIGFDEDNMIDHLKKVIVKQEKMIFFGSTNKPEEILQVSDVFCLPSHREGFGTSVLEASLLSIPVICSNTYGLQETIIENITGLRHKVQDVESLYQTMESFYLSPEMRKSMGIEGRKYVLENFTAQNITKEWVVFYHNLFQR